MLPDEEKDVGLAFQEFAEVFLDVLPISLGIRTGGRDEKKLRMLLVREPDNLSINRRSASCSYLSTTDRNNRSGHVFILASSPCLLRPRPQGSLS